MTNFLNFFFFCLFAGQPSKSSHGYLCDVTNIASSLLSKGNAPVGLAGERSPSPKRKRRSCTLSVSYKEPSIAGWVFSQLDIKLMIIH